MHVPRDTAGHGATLAKGNDLLFEIIRGSI